MPFLRPWGILDSVSTGIYNKRKRTGRKTRIDPRKREEVSDMTGKHTTDVSEQIEDLVATDIAEIWADIELLGKETDSEKWKAKLSGIAKEYLISSRFALMRTLQSKGKIRFPKENSPESATVSMEDAKNLSPEEHAACLQYLLEIAGPSPEEDPDLHERILSRAWHDMESAGAVMAYFLPDSVKAHPKQLEKHLSRIEKECKKRYSTSFTREEAFQLGHILRFTLEEMQHYLMRVFDLEEGFRMNRASDLIEAYCFLTEASCRRADTLKTQYREKTRDIGKQDDVQRSQNWTRQTTGGFLERIEAWKQYPETMDENFLSWLAARASGLDLPSHTAGRIYRNLAAYAYAGALPSEELLYDELMQLAETEEVSEEALECLYSDGTVSETKCQEVAEHLYWTNKVITDSEVKDNTKTWSVITTRKDKELSVSYGSINSSRTRIQSLLRGTEEVEKGDLLYLLWFVFNLVWSDSGTTSNNVVYDRIFDLKDIANAFLEQALLPPFYPPHLMEQSMLLSIIYAGKTGTDPSVIYGTVLRSLRDTRAAGKKAGKHTLQEKLEIISDYRAYPDMSLKQCATKYGISEQTISRWQKELIEEGYFPSGQESASNETDPA